MIEGKSLPFDPWTLPRKELETITEEFRDPEYPDHPIKLTLTALGAIESSAAMQEAQTFSSLYVGTKEDPAEGAFIGPDGEEVALNDIIIRDICFLRQMQPADQRYSFQWWVGLVLRMSGAYAAISTRAAQLNKRHQAQEGNSPMASGSTSKPSAKSSSKTGATQS